MAEIEGEFGQLDFLVNNAGIRHQAAFLDHGLDEWRRTFDVNLTGAFICSQAVIRRMQPGGRVVNIASIAGVLGLKNRIAYRPPRPGVIGMTKAMAFELGAAGICVNAIGPGVIETSLTASYFEDEAFATLIRDNVPLGRWGQTSTCTAPRYSSAGRARSTSPGRCCASTAGGSRARGTRAMIVRGEAGDRYPWKPITLAQQLALTAAAHPDRDALVFEDRRLSWAETQREVTRVARALRAAGVERGDHVAVWVPNHIEWILLWLGANSIGAVIVADQHPLQDRGGRLHPAPVRREAAGDGRRVRGIDYLAMLARLREEDLPELRDVLVIGTPGMGRVPRLRRMVEIDVDAIAYDDPSFIVYTRHHRLPERRGALQPRAAQRVLDLRGDGHRRVEPGDEPHAVLPHRRRVHGRACRR